MVEALRRLREEIDAAFDAQRRPISSQRHVEEASANLTPKWAQVTALLASVGRPTVKTRTQKHFSEPFAPFNPSAGKKKPLQRTEKEMRTLLRQFLIEWRRFAHSAALVTRLHVRARRRGEIRLSAAVLHAWKNRVNYCTKLQRSMSLVKKWEERATLSVMWTKWTCEQQKVRKLRAFCLQKGKRVSCQVFCAWELAASQRKRYRKYKLKAARQLLRRSWRWLKAGIEAQKAVKDEVERFCSQRVVNLLESCVTQWGEYVEEQKQWKFAVQWSEKRVLGDAYDFWRDFHEYTRRNRNAWQLATRFRRLRVLGDVLDEWKRFIQREQARKRAIVMVLHKQKRRKAFIHLILNAQLDRERERSLQDWKTLRTVRKWLDRSHFHRSLRLRAEFLKENHDLLILRKIGWGLWRQRYLRLVMLREFSSRRRDKQLRKFWMAFVAVVNQLERIRLLVEGMIDRREVRHLRYAIFEWCSYMSFMRERKDLVARTGAVRQRKLLFETLSAWKAAYNILRREKSLDAIATRHLVSKFVQHWARWAFWSKRELTMRIVKVIERRQQQRVHQYIVHWRKLVYTRQKTLYRKFFNSWRKAVKVQHLECHIETLRRLVHLRWRWQRWRLHVFQCQEMRCTTVKVVKLHSRRLLKHSFITVWLCKTRGYSMGSSLLKNFGERHLLTKIFTNWREKHSRQSAMKRAEAFRCTKLQGQYLRRFYAVTVTRSQLALSCARQRHLVQIWVSWVQFYMVKRRRCEAEAHFRRHSKQKAVRLLHLWSVKTIKRQSQQIEAQAWYEAVLLQNIMTNWNSTTRRMKQYQALAFQLSWTAVGRRAFHLWQEVLLEKQQMKRAAHFHSTMILKRSWNALIRVMKRRQVAFVVLNYVMKRIRSIRVFSTWKTFTTERHGQYTVAATMYRMRQQRVLQLVFTAWSVLIAARRLSSRLERLKSLRWRRMCWTHWKLWRISSRWQRFKQRSVLQTTFSQGLRRFALQQQTCREICGRTARTVLHQSFARWRVELWLVRNQKKMVNEAKRKILTRWKTYVAACRQKRRWEHYIQQLHRSQTGKQVGIVQNKRKKTCIFHDTRALQAQLKRSRVLMTHVLHAWYLVVQNRRRRLLVKSKRSVKRPYLTDKGRQKALEFWAHRVTQKCFMTWRKGARRRAERA